MKRMLMITLLLALIVPADATGADVTLYNSITDAPNMPWVQVMWYWWSGPYYRRVASSFSTGTFSGTLSSVVLPLHSEGAHSYVAIHGDDGGVPGDYVGQLAFASGGMSSDHVDGDTNHPIFGSSTYSGSGITLAPNTTYWVVLGVQGGQYDFCVGGPNCGGEFWWLESHVTTTCNERLSVSAVMGGAWQQNCFSYLPQMKITGSTTLQPVANAGANGTAHPGSVATLTGSGSSDPSGLSLAYFWEFVSVPSESSATLSHQTAVSPSFTVDQPGDYVVRLVVTNSDGAVSAPATVTISTYNTAPVADAGLDQAIVQLGTTVALTGTSSYDVDGDAITYSWTFASKPSSSGATLNGGTTSTPTFVADVQGTYVVQLIVSDPWAASTPKTVNVSFNNVKPVANAGTGQIATGGGPHHGQRQRQFRC